IYSDGGPVISAVATICYAVFPNLQNLNMAAINEVVTVHSSSWQESILIQYIVCNILYSTIYCTAIVWLAVFLFKRKEIV
ncbi:MAG: hypothetical protein ACYSR7_04420, partial [Planctomycetota bacterium]